MTEAVQPHLRHKALVDAIPDTVLRVSRHGLIIDARTTERERGLWREGAPPRDGMILSDVVDDDLHDTLLEALTAAMDTGDLAEILWSGTTASHLTGRRVVTVEGRAPPTGATKPSACCAT